MNARIPFSLFIGLASSLAVGQESTASCAARHAAVNERGDHVMGFDHDKTTHHFHLTSDGGVIEVSANDSKDTESRDAIRSHLPHIAKMFTSGDFDAPMLIHGQPPPGVPVMERDKERIRWAYEETPAGGRVVASSKDKVDVTAIHEFLIFQIKDHDTGDPTAIEPAASK